MPRAIRRKKLIDVARYLVQAGQRKADQDANEEVYSDLLRYGASDEVIEAYREKHAAEQPQEGEQIVFPDNAEAVMLFTRSSTQWVMVPMLGRVALNYVGVESVARAIGIAWSDELLGRLQILEAETLKAYREKA